MIRAIQLEVYEKHQIILTAIGVYSINTSNPKVMEIQKEVKEIALSHEYVRQLHGFYLDEDKKTMRFDIVISLESKDRLKVYKEVVSDVKNHYPEYKITAFPDIDFAEE